MSQLNMMAHNHHNGSMRISPQNMPPSSHLQSSTIPVSSATIMTQSSSAQPINHIQQSPSHTLSLRLPSPEKKSTDINVDSSDEIISKTSTAGNTPEIVNTDIRTNSIAALRIKAKEHLENINKNLTMV
jgi:hypothetical protein